MAAARFSSVQPWQPPDVYKRQDLRGGLYGVNALSVYRIIGTETRNDKFLVYEHACCSQGKYGYEHEVPVAGGIDGHGRINHLGCGFRYTR